MAEGHPWRAPTKWVVRWLSARRSSEVGPEPRQCREAQGPEAEDLEVLLVGEVLDPESEVHALQAARPAQQAPRPTRVDPVVPGVPAAGFADEGAGNHVGLDEEGQARDRRDGDACVPAVARDAWKLPPHDPVVGLGVREGVVHAEEQPVQGLELRPELEPLGPSAAEVRGLKAECPRDLRKGDEILERIAEVGEAEPDPVLPEPLVGACLPALAALGLEVHVPEGRAEARRVGKEEVVQGRGPEALPVPAPELRPRLLEQVRERQARRPLAAEGVAVLETHAAPEDETVEETELVLEEERARVDLLPEGAAVPGALVLVLQSQR